MMKYRERRAFGFKSKLKLSIVIFLCFCFFLVGLFGSMIISQDVNKDGRFRHKLLEDIPDEEGVLMSLSHGESGEFYVNSIPFQVLSWRPRAVYFPHFATVEQCKSIIETDRMKLRPSGLALRPGETADSTKGIRTSSGTFLSASEDRSGALECRSSVPIPIPLQWKFNLTAVIDILKMNVTSY